jgi:hypothetical protein
VKLTVHMEMIRMKYNVNGINQKCCKNESSFVGSLISSLLAYNSGVLMLSNRVYA